MKTANPIELSDGRLLINLAKALYEKQSVFAAAYKYKNQCFIEIEPTDEHHVGVYLKSDKLESAELKELAEKFQVEVLDQQHRLDLNKKFGRIRELIVEQAFYPVANLEDKINGK